MIRAAVRWGVFLCVWLVVGAAWAKPQPPATAGETPSAAQPPAKPAGGSATSTPAAGSASGAAGPASAPTLPAANPTPPAGMVAPTDLGQGSGVDYQAKLRELEEKVVEVKEDVFQAKTRLLLLQEEILQNVIAEAKVVIVHSNEMGSFFTLERVVYFLDTDQIYVQENRGGQLEENARFEVFNGNLSPGNHLLSVEMTYHGTGTFFTYLDKYRVKISANYTFAAVKGRIMQIEVVGYKKGTAALDLDKRPSIKFKVSQVQYRRDNVKKPAPEGTMERPSEPTH